MSNVDINVDGRTDGRKIGCLYRTLLQAGAIMTSHKWNIIHLVQVLSELTFNMFSNKRIFHYISSINFKYLLKFIYIIILVCTVMKITKK